jgi:transposase
MASPAKSPSRRRGRPKLTEVPAEVQQKIIQALLGGNYLETAAAYAGIHKSTLYNWLKRGARQKTGPFRDFSDAVRKAQADAEVRDVARIAQAAAVNWQACAWRLERKFPAKWGRRQAKGYSAEQFTAFVMRVVDLVRKHLLREKRLVFQQELDALLKQMERERVGRDR